MSCDPTDIEHIERKVQLCAADVSHLSRELEHLRNYIETSVMFHDLELGELGSQIASLRKELKLPPID